MKNTNSIKKTAKLTVVLCVSVAYFSLGYGTEYNNRENGEFKQRTYTQNEERNATEKLLNQGYTYEDIADFIKAGITYEDILSNFHNTSNDQKIQELKMQALRNNNDFEKRKNDLEIQRMKLELQKGYLAYQEQQHESHLNTIYSEADRKFKAINNAIAVYMQASQNEQLRIRDELVTTRAELEGRIYQNKSDRSYARAIFNDLFTGTDNGVDVASRASVMKEESERILNSVLTVILGTLDNLSKPSSKFPQNNK